MEVTIPNIAVWMILLLPLAAFALVAAVTRFTGKPWLSGYLSICATLVATCFSLWALLGVMSSSHHEVIIPGFNWLVIGNSIEIKLGIILDSLTAVMLVVVTIVSLMVQIYSQGYMKGDPGYHRYYAFMSLFTASMLGMVLADNLLMLFFFWELVGLCSYLLIGFWFNRPPAANAAKKAFIVTRIGDFGLLAAILLLFSQTGTLDIAQLHNMALAGTLTGAALTWAAIGIFVGAAGKSAQFPLHVWLPDAMEGPTPVSALIHAATMVAAGIFLVARMFPLFEASPEALTVVSVIGAVTAIFAASIGLVMNDIKRVLAYSTISQLGYMMLGLGTGGVAVGIFHLFTHAFFKSLLFLGSGTINHATGTFDMRLMGGLRKIMPWTFATFLIASLSIIGIWPLAGFWSKEEILSRSLESQPLLFALAMITVFMTAFYMFRVVFMTFGGEYRGESHPHEAPRVMVIPMVLLSLLAIGAGWFNVSGAFGSFLGHGETHGFIEGFFSVFTHPLTWISLLMAGAGVLLAYAIYSAKWLSAERIGKLFSPFYKLFSHKYWLDEIYEVIIGKRLLSDGLFAGFKLLDSRIIDGAVNGAANAVDAAGDRIRKAQTGQLQLYGLFMLMGIAAILIVLFITG